MSNADILGLFVWHELMTTDPRAAAAFYSKILPWSAQPSTTPDYMLWMSGSAGVGGLMAQPDEAIRCATPPSWLIYLGTANVDATVETARQLGGSVLKAPTDIPTVGRFAVLGDPQGAAFAVFTPLPPSASDTAGPRVISGFSWHELATTDLQAAIGFYSRLFGWSTGPAHDMGAGNLYQIIEHQGAQVGGAYRQQDPSKPAHWLTYLKVDALEEAVAAARAAGGRIIQEPHEVPGGDRVAHLLDPQGGAIALHQVRIAAAARKPAAPAARGNKARKRPGRRATSRKGTAKPAPRARRSARVKAKAAARSAARKNGKRVAGAKRPPRKAGKAKAASRARTAKAQSRARKTVSRPKRKSGRRR